MKVVVNLLNFNSNSIAGVGYFMKRIFELLDSHNTEGISFYILHAPNINVQEVFSISKNLRICYKPVKHSNKLLFRIFYEQLVLPFKLSKYNVFFSPTPAVPILLSWFNRKIKVIPTIHDLIPFYIKNKYSFLRGIYVRWITKKSAQISHSIITVSNNSRNDIVRTLEVKKEKVHVVYNFIPNRKLVKSEISKNYFITVCTIEPGKNLPNLLKAFKLYKNKYDTTSIFKLYVVGKNGWAYKQVYQLCEELDLQNSVIFTGYLSEEDKNNLIRESSAMIYLSTYEGFGIPPLEAMYWNKPSVVSNVSSLPEVVGDAGIKCDPYNLEEIADSIFQIVNNKDKYCIHIPQQLQKFAPQKQVNKFLQILKL